MFIPTKYYQNMSEGNKSYGAHKDASRDGWMDAILITVSPEPFRQGIKLTLCRKVKKSDQVQNVEKVIKS